MKILKVILGIIGVLILFVLAAYAYYGGFYSISPEIQQSGGETLVYEKMTGDYAQSGVVSDRVYYELIDGHAIETTRGFGIFYDNPKTVETQNLRADVGCILESDFSKLESLEGDFEITEYPVAKYLVADFPFKGKPSIIIGIMKVYPMMNSYLEENGYEVDSPMMEIWDVPNKKILYRKTLIKIES